MTRDRFADLQRVRAQAHLDIERGRASFGSSFRKTFRRTFTEDVKRCIKKIGDEVERVKKLHSAILSSPAPDKRVQQELDQLMATIKRSSNGVRAKLKEIDSALKKEEEEATLKNPTGVVYVKADIRMRKIQYAALSRLFVDTMTIYQTAQADYRDRWKGRIKRHLDIVGSELSDDEVEKMMEEGNWSVFTHDILQDTAEARQTLADIQARYDDMMKLEKSIRELHDMFMEMALLIETQGELIDRIEFNVGNAQEYVESYTKEIREAYHFQRDARKIKIWPIVIAIVIILVIGLIIFLCV